MDLHLLLLLLLAPLTAFGEEKVPDYDNPYSPIFTDKLAYSWTDKMKITIVAPSWNSDRHLIDSIGDTADHPIKISTRENSLDQYRFTETDVNSGVFTAEVILTGFLHDSDGDGDFDTIPRTTGNGPTSGFLEVKRDSAVTISFEFANGVVLTESVPVRWNLGSIEFLQNTLPSDESVTIHIVDLDMNLNPEALDHIPIYLFSDSDSAGIKVNAVETFENSGMFVSIISLSQTLPSSGDRLYALLGDKIFAKYNDHTLPKPHSISDSLKLETFARIDSSVPPLQRLKSSTVFLSDRLGNQLQSIPANKQIQIVGTVTNEQDFDQNFVYLFQARDPNGFIESLSWIKGELHSKQSLDVSQSWIPKKSGTYQLEIFVWNSLNAATALAPVSSLPAMVTIE